MSRIEYIFKAYFVRLTAFAYPWVGSEAEAKDIVQDAYLVLIDRHDILEKEDAVVKSFLYSTVKHKAMNQQRKTWTATRLNQTIKQDESDHSDLLESLIRAEIVGELHHELTLLPEGCQHICRLIYLEGMKYEEVAAELNISINTVKTQRQRALAILKQKFLSVLFFFL